MKDALVSRALVLTEAQSISEAPGNGPSVLPPIPPHYVLRGHQNSLEWSSLPHLVGMEDSAACFMLAHDALTYVFVHELALVPVIQVDELGSTLLLSVHPATDILTAGLCVEVGALPVPGEDKTGPLGHCPGWRTDPRTDRELRRGQLTGDVFLLEGLICHSTHGTLSEAWGQQKPTASTRTAFPVRIQGCLTSTRWALCAFPP